MLFYLFLSVRKGTSLLRVSMSYQRGVKTNNDFFHRGGHPDPTPFRNFWIESIQKLRFELVPEGATIAETTTCVGGNNGQMVLLDKSTNNIPGKIIATIDIQQPNRAFIGHQLEGTYTTIHTTGGILYFDKEGKQCGLIKTFSESVIDSDFRNGVPRTLSSWDECLLKPNKQNLILCGPTLLHIWNHRDIRGDVTLSGALMDEDKVKSNIVFRSRRKCDLRFDPPLLVHLNRWLCIPDSNKNDTLCYDMNSFKTSSEPEEGSGNRMKSILTYDAVTLPSTANLTAELEALAADVPSPEPTERGGYPTKCIKCGGDTVQGLMIWPEEDILTGLGRAVCYNCMIRFSLTEQVWECTKPTANTIGRCSKEVHGPHYCCSKRHAPYHFQPATEEQKEKARENNQQLRIDLHVVPDGEKKKRKKKGT